MRCADLVAPPTFIENCELRPPEKVDSPPDGVEYGIFFMAEETLCWDLT